MPPAAVAPSLRRMRETLAEINPGRRGRTILLAGAAVLSLTAVWSVAAVLAEMPIARVARLFSTTEKRARFQTTTRETLANASSQVREAYILLHVVQEQITPALRGAVDPYAAEQEAQRLTQSLRESRLGDLLTLTARLLALEREGAPLDRWWYAARPVLEHLQHAGFAHRLGPLADAWAGGVRGLRVGAGTAQALVRATISEPYGPFLQYFTRRILFLAEAREQVGDTAGAELCRGLVRRLLRQWVLEPGMPGAQLQAAELLAESLEDESAGADSRPAAPRAELRALREAYHGAVATRPPNAIGLRDESVLAPRAHAAAAGRLAMQMCVLGAAAGAGVTALATCWFWLRARAGVRVRWDVTLVAGLACVAVCTAGAAALSRSPAVQLELRGDWSSWRWWWWTPIGAAAAGMVLSAAGGTLGWALSGRRDVAAGMKARGAHSASAPVSPRGLHAWVSHVGLAALVAWGALAVAVMLAGASAWGALADYEAAVGAGYGDPLIAVAGGECESMISVVSAWEP